MMLAQGRARHVILSIASILLAAVPFAFALIRLFQTGDDFRYLWMAIVSFLGAAGVMTLGAARTRGLGALTALSGAALIVATLLGVTTAVLLGTTFGPGAAIVALGFGLCSAVGQALNAVSRRI
jgi:hypothetical protein